MNFEDATSHAITVAASDGEATVTQDFTIAVTNVAPSGPVDNEVAANTVAEGAANGTEVGIDVSSSDPNGTAGGGPVTFSLADNAGGRFAINSAGVVTVADGTLLNFEDATSHTISVAASDGEATVTQDFTIAVTNVAPSGPVDNEVAANTVAEGAANGTEVGIDVSSSDPNGTAGGGPVTFSLADNAGGRFAIDSAGLVTVADGTLLDFEDATSHTITVAASDGLVTVTQDFTIEVTNVAPNLLVDDDPAPDTVAEGAANGTQVGIDVSATDPSGMGSVPGVSFALTDDADGRFAIDADGVVTVADGTRLDGTTTHVITVSAGDGTSTATRDFTIEVTNVQPIIDDVESSHPDLETRSDDGPGHDQRRVLRPRTSARHLLDRDRLGRRVGSADRARSLFGSGQRGHARLRQRRHLPDHRPRPGPKTEANRQRHRPRRS